MCIIVAKYFDKVGWVGVKNRDRNYVPEISFKRVSFNFWSINDPKHRLWVEILSNRVLYRDRKRQNDPAPPKMSHKV